MSDTHRTRVQEIRHEFLYYATHHASDPVSWRPFKEAFLSGEQFGLASSKRDCICGGEGCGLEVDGAGRVKCFKCSPVIHFAQEGMGPACGIVTDQDVVTENNYGSVTCPYCLHVLLRKAHGDEDRCTSCGEDAGPNLCNGCR
jgi:hypothetical protein